MTSNLTRKRRVNILNCETLRYMNNSRHLNYMDFIRFEMMFRTPLFDNTVKKSLYGILGSQKIIYKKPLKMWSVFTITLVLEGWDDKWVYHKQAFKQQNEIRAVGYTKAAFWKGRNAQNIPGILKHCGVTIFEMPPTQQVLNMFKTDYELLN